MTANISLVFLFVFSFVIVQPPATVRADEAAPSGAYPGGMVVVEPDPGREKVGPVKPTWCDLVESDPGEEPSKVASRIGRALQSSAQHWFSSSNIQMLLEDFCAFPDDPGFQKQAGYMLQLWVNVTGQTKEDAITSMKARADAEAWDSALSKSCDELRAPDEASPEEEELVRARRTLFCSPRGVYYLSRYPVSKDYEWYIDRTDQPPSELDRVTYALSCVPASGDWTKNDWIQIGQCAGDVQRLSREKVVADTAKMSAPFKAIALESYSTAKAVFADLERSAKSSIDSDVDYRKLLVDAPKAAWDAWVKTYKKHKAAMDATFAFEKKLFSSRKSAVEGCWGGVEPNFATFVKAQKFKTKAAFMESMRDPVGYVLVNAVGACYAVSSPAQVGGVLLDINDNKQSRVWRGPRSAVRHAMTDVLNEIKADRTRFPVSLRTGGPPNLILREASSRLPSRSSDFTEAASGVVKSTAKGAEEMLRVIFKTDTWTEATVSCRDTKQIQYIRDGRVIYRRACKNTGQAKRTFTPKTTMFYGWSAKGLRPNAFVKMLVPPGSEYGKAGRQGYPVEVYTNKGQKKLVTMYGFPL